MATDRRKMGRINHREDYEHLLGIVEKIENWIHLSPDIALGLTEHVKNTIKGHIRYYQGVEVEDRYRRANDPDHLMDIVDEGYKLADDTDSLLRLEEYEVIDPNDARLLVAQAEGFASNLKCTLEDLIADNTREAYHEHD